VTIAVRPRSRVQVLSDSAIGLASSPTGMKILRRGLARRRMA